MGDDPEEITIPTETQNLTLLRRVVIYIFVALAVAIFGATLVSLASV